MINLRGFDNFAFSSCTHWIWFHYYVPKLPNDSTNQVKQFEYDQDQVIVDQTILNSLPRLYQPKPCWSC